MKIRTSFVTNSSGSSSSRVTIENEELYNLLKKYTDDINNRLKEIDNSSIKIVDMYDGVISDYGDCGTKDNFWYYVDDSSIKDIPSAYIKRLDYAINEYKEDDIINSIFNELKKELKEKEELINEMYSNLEMSSDFSYDDGSIKSQTIINKENKCPKCGDTLVYKYYSEYSRQNTNTYETLICKNPNCIYSIKVEDKKIEIQHDDYLPIETDTCFNESELDELKDELPF